MYQSDANDREDYDRPFGYLSLLERIHETLRPRTYLEVGVNKGSSLTRIPLETLAIGIDPVAAIRTPVNASAKLYFETSDDFFAHHDPIVEFGGRRIDSAFIDGAHVFESALRDFANIERFCSPQSIILIHDCYPQRPEYATLVRNTANWGGDVWKLVVALRRWRPDLDLTVAAVGGTGLGMATNLDPNNRVIFEEFDGIVAEINSLTLDDLDFPALARPIASDWDSVAGALPARQYATPGELPPSKKARRWNARIVSYELRYQARLAKRRLLREGATWT
jgi:hypothetical protein